LNRYEKWLKSIEFTSDLDGCGPILAPIFEKALSGKKFNTAFEWCAGPAWIGMWLLENNICKSLVTGDINEKTINFVNKSSKKHNYNVRTYHSDNLKNIPKQEKFDLVVSNPPNYCNIQQSHTYGYMRNDLRPSDIDWKIHKDFYKNIGEYLNDEAIMFISEIEPYSREVYILNELYDRRSEIPMKEFKVMTESNNLKIINKIPYNLDGLDCYILEIVKRLNN
jgi:methylase of polypeptide subunit release factors